MGPAGRHPRRLDPDLRHRHRGDRPYVPHPVADSGKLRSAVTAGGGGAEQRIEAAPLPTGQWVHVAVAYGTGTAILYDGGREVGRDTAVTVEPSTSATTSAPAISAGRGTRTRTSRPPSTTSAYTAERSAGMRSPLCLGTDKLRRAGRPTACPLPTAP
ncbi:LamG-like jellyroll fold domain-containing protein [Streptomyces antimycoticus]|uniref:LamG-like jellyroll fold domain-containing protein n=1 Tax=Streptomyces antimycoticus TaxID=68175 RepID=UPI0033F8C596